MLLSGAAAFQCLQRVAWRAEIVKRPGRVKLKQFSNRSLFDGLQLPGPDSQKHLLGFGISKGPDHAFDRISIDNKQSRRFTVSDTVDRITVPAHAWPEQVVSHPTLGLDALRDFAAPTHDQLESPASRSRLLEPEAGANGRHLPAART